MGAQFRWAAIAFALLFGPAGGAATAQGQAAGKRAEVEAAFLRNFARYVTWPAASFTSERAPWSVCILGDDRFDDALEKTFQGRTEQGRPFEVLRTPTHDLLAGCQIVYVGYVNSARRRAILNELRTKPILTVGDAPQFLDEGGIIRLLAAERIEMSINLDQARAVSLAIPAKMLEVSHGVLENGTMRKLR